MGRLIAGLVAAAARSQYFGIVLPKSYHSLHSVLGVLTPIRCETLPWRAENSPIRPVRALFEFTCRASFA